MRSQAQALLRRSKVLVKASTSHSHSYPLLSTLSPPLRPLRKDQLLRNSNRITTRPLTSTTSSNDPLTLSESPEAPDAAAEPNSEAEPPTDGPEKPRSRRTIRVAVAPTKDLDPVRLPDDLDILWTPEGGPTETTALPPEEILEDALHNLLITLHPQTQNRATYTSPSGPLIEPTLGLYCPIEGGEYVIDATVRELARRIGAEVLVLDAAHLAAGEWGKFGAAASSLSLPRNPLHFPSSSPPAQGRRDHGSDEDDEVDSSSMFSQPQQMTLAVMSPQTIQGRAILTSPPKRNSPPGKAKAFFDALVNIPSSADLVSSPSSTSKPRLVYVRDYPTLAPMSSSWYPPLLSAVRERRRGPMIRPTSPVVNPMTIIFGMAPPLTPPLPQGSPSNGLMNLLMSRSSTTRITAEPKAGKSEWDEGEVAEKARERRLRDRLKKWERSDVTLLDEFHKPSTVWDGGTPEDRPDIILIGGGSGMPGFPPMLGAGMPASQGRADSDGNSSFFRTSIVVPSARSSSKELATRIARRREINELTMRMGIGAAGGALDQESGNVIHNNHMPEPTESEESIETSKDAVPESDSIRMWKDWGNHIEVWSNVRSIADRAIGSTLSAAQMTGKLRNLTLDPTSVSWSTVHRAWTSHRTSQDLRRSWLKESLPSHKTVREHDEENNEEDEKNSDVVDEVIERIKNEADLDPHEQRLLSCIVDSASMPTSFNQVHLPPHTIDSVRTIVSLPLLHPQAFQQGILRHHGMTGCLLFGPPGTGKTLVVRALAKEAGCRMMTISPSDVMDMYVGEGEKLVKAVFSLARRLSPCVVFLDEIDALFGARMSARESGGAFAHRGVITEFMQEMDGLKSSHDTSVIVIGATNRPFDLDDAVLRRLPRRLLVDLPGEKEREEILKILLRDEKMADDLDIRALAVKTESFSGSDLKHLCVSAALDAVKENVVLPWSRPISNHWTPPATTAYDTEKDPIQKPSSSQLDHQKAQFADTTSPTPTMPAIVLDAASLDAGATPVRKLHLHNFAKALKEITPSSSEALGSLAELRKWNDEFGEGRKDRKRRQVWGKGRFGFTDNTNHQGKDGRVLNSLPDSNDPIISVK